ncbi:hypothetical protein RFI_04241 [Reticulomyxa filosa]|uniref:Uncharacterized protein n=1 Tax=Reticulomyxa filosa TaxID=46433 RepID=X6P2W9_RETFI|nr:hypothetical protein RFI_04241 [Reticulomyxa filosa]|eukprot:ETO32875.1 hypothetical protein RFI_04241 [Reticulomyxa filosa]
MIPNKLKYLLAVCFSCPLVIPFKRYLLTNIFSKKISKLVCEKTQHQDKILLQNVNNLGQYQIFGDTTINNFRGNIEEMSRFVRGMSLLYKPNGFLRHSKGEVWKKERKKQYNTKQKRGFADPGEWQKLKFNSKYVFYDFTRPVFHQRFKIVPITLKFLDDYFMRSNASYFTLIILGVIAYDKTVDQLVDWWWWRINKDRLFVPEVLDKFLPPAEEEEDDDDF